MTYLLSFAFFGLAAHMLDAGRHYWREDEPISFALNFTWGAIALLIGIVLFLKAR